VLNITSAGWQVILCDPIWHMSSHSGEASCELLCSVHLYLTLNVSALWVSQNLCAHDQCQWVASSQELLISHTSDEELFCRRLVTGDKLWIYHWDPLSKLKFMQWKDVYCPTFTSMCNSAINWLWQQFFWDTDGLLMADYLHPGGWKDSCWSVLYRTNMQVTRCYEAETVTKVVT